MQSLTISIPIATGTGREYQISPIQRFVSGTTRTALLYGIDLPDKMEHKHRSILVSAFTDGLKNNKLRFCNLWGLALRGLTLATKTAICHLRSTDRMS